ncbi:DNA pilot protein [Dipodfec virus RodF1_64]|uniref:DNA pilot protein n=1 Tax=Dipodfec virus RodF1_64 TaxID=2929306 RepID=A0A976N2D1_9VIRU|nr:DNA pilot protein [Dipodfec virus RodF1_64]
MADYLDNGLPVDGSSGGALLDFVNSSAGKAYLNQNSGQTAAASADNVNTSSASDPIYGQLGGVQSWLEYVSGINAQNNAISQANAREQMDFQREQNAIAMLFNATEAQKSRDWQGFMSNTAHYREVADLIAAGLNPVLAANNGSSTPSGATASGVTSSGAMGNVDTSGASAAASLLGTVIDASTQLKAITTSAETALRTAEINQETQKYVAGIAAGASMYSADKNYAGTKYSADSHYAGTRYGADAAAAASRAVAGIQAASNQSINSANNANDRYMASNYPSTPIQAFSSLLNPNGYSDLFGFLKKFRPW